MPARPGISGDRPIIGGGNRPGGDNRPIIGGGNNIVNRPGGNNNFVNINNRNNWGYGVNRPGYGHWADHWYGHYIPPHYHGWYHGCWSGNWGNYWYVPFVAGATAWGLNALLPSWGYSYGYSYSNPYYVESSSPAYDYSQPIAINTYNTLEAEASSGQQAAADQTPAAESPQMTEAYQLFDQALAAFKTGDYQNALTLDQRAIQKSPQDPVMHEISALCLFALGDYKQAAAVLDNLLAVAPGMDWTTLCSLYPSVDVYTTQLRALESYCRANPNDASAHFVLAYHYLVAGHSAEAIKELKLVAAKQPGDQVAKRMLDALSPPAEQTAAAPQPGQPADSSSADTGPTTDLVGSWRAERNGDVFDLTIDENSQFTWKATPKGKPPITIGGNVTATSNLLVLESKDQGSMVGNVISGGRDQFQFVTTGGPADDKGLTFKRVKTNS